MNAHTFEDCVPKWFNSKYNFCHVRPNLRKLFCVFRVCLANESFKKSSCYVSFEAKHYIKLHVDYSDAYMLIHFRFPLIWQKFKSDTYHFPRSFELSDMYINKSAIIIISSYLLATCDKKTHRSSNPNFMM